MVFLKKYINIIYMFQINDLINFSFVLECSTNYYRNNESTTNNVENKLSNEDYYRFCGDNNQKYSIKKENSDKIIIKINCNDSIEENELNKKQYEIFKKNIGYHEFIGEEYKDNIKLYGIVNCSKNNEYLGEITFFRIIYNFIPWVFDFILNIIKFIRLDYLYCNNLYIRIIVWVIFSLIFFVSLYMIFKLVSFLFYIILSILMLIIIFKFIF